MRVFLLTSLLCSSVVYGLFDLNDRSLHEIEFFDVQDEYPAGALTTERGIVEANGQDDELVAALEMIRSFTVHEDMQLRVAVRDLCLRIMYIK